MSFSKSLKLSARKIALNTSIFLVVAGASLFTIETQTLINQWGEFDKSLILTKNLKSCFLTLKDMETGQRGYLLTGRQQYLVPFETGSLALDSCLANLEKSVDNSEPESLTLFKQITDLSNKKEKELRSTIILKQQGHTEQALAIVNSDIGKNLMDDVSVLVRTSEITNDQKTAALRNMLAKQLQIVLYVFLAWVATLAMLMSLILVSMKRSQQLLRKAKEKLAFDAAHDTLTGLPNRRYLMDWLASSLSGANQLNTSLGILYIDLDGFSVINNTLGHQAGDDALVWTASVFKQTLRETDFVARLGGDEFVIMTTGQTVEQLEQFAQRLLRIFESSSFRPDSAPGSIGLSIGIATVPYHASSTDDLLRAADEAMYAAKDAGKRCYRIAKSLPNAVNNTVAIAKPRA